MSPEQKIILLPTIKIELDPGGIASGDSDYSQQFLSEALFKDSTLKYDKDDSSVGYVETFNLLIHSGGRDCRFSPLTRYTKLECSDQERVSGEKSAHPSPKSS